MEAHLAAGAQQSNQKPAVKETDSKQAQGSGQRPAATAVTAADAVKAHVPKLNLDQVCQPSSFLIAHISYNQQCME